VSSLDKVKLLEMKNIVKCFSGVTALKGVDFELYSGEIVSLVGVNGAGKSTLSSIIAGIYEADEGEIYVKGKLQVITSPKKSEELGIGIVHQEPTLVNGMIVWENIFLNRELLKTNILLDRERMKVESKKILEFIGFDIDVNKKVEELTLVEKEVVEIAKAMLLNPQILILDEVTAPLNQTEVEHLFDIIRDLKTKGLGIIFIGHKIKELTQISDRVVVIRDGNIVGELDGETELLNEKAIIHPMLGETEGWHGEYNEKQMQQHGDEVLLHLDNLTIKGSYNNITLDVYKGEILGFAGLKGAGITELFFSIFGALHSDSGIITKNEKKIQVKNPNDAIKKGIGMITNDRQKEGLALTQSVKDNIVISSLDLYMGPLGLLKEQRLKEQSKNYIKKLDIKTTGNDQLVQFLSGGNQQKVVISKWLMRNMDVILVDEPTRGVDVKAKNEIYNLLIDQKMEKKAILITSPEIRELLNLCDRIIIVSHGKIVNQVMRGDKNFNEPCLLELIHSSH
jgi:ABC-type sugar transport system ATPase subunit